jgi:5-methylcytosine-specific restriction endonuclease McrA
MWLQFDHLLPHQRGGDSSAESVVITCAPCNFGRMDRTLEEVGLDDPRLRPVDPVAWNGLTDLLPY